MLVSKKKKTPQKRRKKDEGSGRAKEVWIRLGTNSGPERDNKRGPVLTMLKGGFLTFNNKSRCFFSPPKPPTDLSFFLSFSMRNNGAQSRRLSHLLGYILRFLASKSSPSYSRLLRLHAKPRRLHQLHEFTFFIHFNSSHAIISRNPSSGPCILCYRRLLRRLRHQQLSCNACTC